MEAGGGVQGLSRSAFVSLPLPCPSDASAVTITRADIVALLEDDGRGTEVPSTRDLTVEEVAKETGRAPSTVRDWLISGALCGYKLNGRDWRVSRAALREYLETQTTKVSETPDDEGAVDIAAWREAK